MSVRSTLPPSSVSAEPGGGSVQQGGPAAPVAPASALAPSTSDAELLAQRRRAIRRRRYFVYALRVLFGVVLVAAWELSARMNWTDPFFFGMPSRIAARLWLWITQGTALGPLWLQIAITMEETILGFVVGVLFGVTFGVLLGRIRLLSDVLSPYIKAGNSIPRVVLGAIFTIMFGLGLTPKVMTAAILVFFVVFFNAFQGVREVDPNLIANARILGAGNRRLTTEIIVPSALTWIVASLHISFGLALVGAVVGELFGATQGVGELIYNSKNLFDADGVYAGMLLLAVLALVAESLITLIENRLITWRPRQVSGATTI